MKKRENNELGFRRKFKTPLVKSFMGLLARYKGLGRDLNWGTAFSSMPWSLGELSAATRVDISAACGHSAPDFLGKEAEELDELLK